MAAFRATALLTCAASALAGLEQSAYDTENLGEGRLEADRAARSARGEGVRPLWASACAGA